jgi:hypothetical protein
MKVFHVMSPFRATTWLHIVPQNPFLLERIAGLLTLTGRAAAVDGGVAGETERLRTPQRIHLSYKPWSISSKDGSGMSFP